MSASALCASTLLVTGWPWAVPSWVSCWCGSGAVRDMCSGNKDTTMMWRLPATAQMGQSLPQVMQPALHTLPTAVLDMQWMSCMLQNAAESFQGKLCCAHVLAAGRQGTCQVASHHQHPAAAALSSSQSKQNTPAMPHLHQRPCYPSIL